MTHMHIKLYRTPDSKPGEIAPQQIFQDNIAYMDKLVGQLVAELDRLKLREKTLILFTGDNGSGTSRAQLGDQIIAGHKATMEEGGSRVPLIANWPGTTPAGVVNHDLTDFSDFFPTAAEVAGVPLPAGVTIDGQSFAAQIKGKKGRPREWVYVELDGKSYVRDARYKLTNDGKMFDLKNAPFEEIPVPADSKDPATVATRQRLQKILDQHPAAPSRRAGGDVDA
jgi:arylsulfatase A